MMMEMVLIRGLPGSGKTTMAKKMVGYEHYEADQFFEKNGKYNFELSKIVHAHAWSHAWCIDRIKDCMIRKKNLVVSNTFTQKWEMRKYIDAAIEYGYSIRIIEACGSWDNIHGVPDDVIEKMKLRWEPINVARIIVELKGE